MGVCAVDSAFYHSVGNVMHAADVAMYCAKEYRDGCSRYHLSVFKGPGKPAHNSTASTT